MDPSPQPTGVALRDPLAWHDFTQIVGTAEAAGYRAVFVPEIAGREGFSTLAGLATLTERLVLATGVVPLDARRVETTAMAAATVQELSGGRLILGVGAGHVRSGALARVRGDVAALRAALGPALPDPGRIPFRVDLPVDPPPAIWLAALGDGMIRLAGEVADGVLLNWCTPERVREARALIAEGARAGGRAPSDVTIGVYVRACIDPDEAIALEALRGPTGQYAALPHYRGQMERMGLGDVASAAAEAARRGRPDAVPEALVRALCVVGDAGGGRALLGAHREAGADLPIVYPVPARDPVSSIMGTVLALGPTPVLQP